MAIEITKEIIENSASYIPIAVKEQLAEQIADWCVIPVKIKLDDDTPFPPLYKENRALRQLFLHGVLARAYFNMDFECESVSVTKDGKKIGEQEIDYYMSANAYDEFNGSHIINQLERLKKDKDIANKIFDILYDYKAFENMTNGAIRDKLAEKNDACGRLYQMISMQSSSDYIENLKAQIPELQKELANLQKTE